MKKRNITILFTIFSLASCSNETISSLNVYKDSRYTIQSIQTQKDSLDIVYYVTIDVKNEKNEEIVINSSDFKMKTSDNEYDCLYFIVSIKMDNQNYYIDEKANTISIKPTENHFDIVWVAFPTNGSGLYELIYKDSILKPIGE